MQQKRFKPIYLLFLLIPAAFYFFLNERTQTKAIPDYDYLYFSAFCSSPATLIVENGKNQIFEHLLEPHVFKYIDFSGKITSTDSLLFQFNNLKAGDTLRLLSVNVFHNNQTHSLYFNKLEKISVSNCISLEKNGLTSYIVQNDKLPVLFKMAPISQWTKKNPENILKLFFCVLFFLIFILIIMYSPEPKYFVFSVLICLSVMFLFQLISKKETGKLVVKTSEKLQFSEFYYNHFPQFTHLKRITNNHSNSISESNIDLITNRYIRFDVEHIKNIENISIISVLGIISYRWDLTKISTSKLLINDMVFTDKGFQIKGKDPYFALTTQYFSNKIKCLVMLYRSCFLFAGLFIFLILLILNSLLSRCFKNLQFRYIYLLFFLLPLTYYISETFLDEKDHYRKHDDYLYFPIKTTKPATVSLFAGKDSLATWYINSKGYKQINYVKNFNNENGFRIKIKDLSQFDTVFLPVVNLYQNNTLYTLFDMTYPYCSVENAFTFIKNGIFHFTPCEVGKDLKIHFNKLPFWDQTTSKNYILALPFLCFTIAFLVLFLTSPSQKYFISLLSFTLITLVLFCWLGKDFQFQLILKSQTAQQNMEIYFSHTPFFNNEEKFMTHDGKYIFRNQVNPVDNPYLRVDFDVNVLDINNPQIILKSGLLYRKWDLKRTNLNCFVPNDVNYQNEKLLITGNDPYLSLATTGMIDDIKRLTFIRSFAYVFISLVIFILMLLFAKSFAKLNTVKQFFFICFIPFISHYLLFSLCNSDRIRLISEKRNAQTFPVFKFDSIKKFNQKFGLYLNDNLPGRNKIIPLNNYLYYSIFGELVNHPDVYFGKEGWMFYIGAKGRETYENRNPLTTEQLYVIKFLFEERNEWLNKQGIQLYIFFPKIAQFIYEDKLGKRMFRYNKTSKLEQLQSFLKKNSSLNIIDLEKPLIEAKKTSDKELYHKTSTHWNYLGGYFAYREIIRFIQKDFPEMEDPIPINEIVWNKTEASKYDIDLLEMTALASYLKGYTYKPQHPKLFAATDTILPDFADYKPDFPTLYLVNKNKKSPNMMMFRDSYAEYLYPYFCYHFHKSSFIWTPTLNRKLIEKEKPDIVFWELSERFIPGFFIYKNPPFAIEELKEQNKNFNIFDYERVLRKTIGTYLFTELNKRIKTQQK